MDKYMVFYQKVPTDGGHMFDNYKIVVEGEIPTKYSYMGTVEADDLEHVFSLMNHPFINPLATDSGQFLVEMSGTGHTSMSVNDVIVDLKTQTIYQVQETGFRVVGIF